MEKCPVCRARFDGTPSCRRCKSDLSALLQVEQEAESLTRRAIHALAQGDKKKACQLCNEALHLKSTPLNKVLKAFLTHTFGE